MVRGDQTHLSDGLQLSQDGVFILLGQGAGQHLVYLLQDDEKKTQTQEGLFTSEETLYVTDMRLTLWYSMES